MMPEASPVSVHDDHKSLKVPSVAVWGDGSVIPPIALRDPDGMLWSLESVEGTNATVIAFLNFNCPVSNQSTPVINDLAAQYHDQEVTFVAVVCDAADPREVVRKASEAGIKFRVFHDPDKVAAAHFGATVTPEVFVLDRHRVLRYSGLVDNLFASRRVRRPKADEEFLAVALDSILAGKQVANPRTTPIGCHLDYSDRAIVEHGAVEFHRDIEPLLQQHCQQCHRPGEVAPFSLITFEHALQWADDIKTYTAERLMPPWVVPSGLPLKRELGLKPDEISLISEWVDSGCPKGDPADAPPPKTFVEPGEWRDSRPPDIVLTLPEAMHLAAQGKDHYRSIVFPLNNASGLHVERAEFIPGNRSIVHHCMAYYDGVGLALDAQERLAISKGAREGDGDYGPGFESGMFLSFALKDLTKATRNPDNPGGHLMGWVPGMGPIEWPDGARRVIPPDSSIVVQIHYTRTGKPEVDDSTRLALWFDENPPALFADGLLLDTDFRVIPKGDPAFRTTGSLEVPSDCQLWLITPHMHRLGKEFRVWHQPVGSVDRKLLFELMNWDFDWQQPYVLKDSYPLERGSKLFVEAVYDNSSNNPNRPPGPEKSVFLGEGTHDEMGFVLMGVLVKEQPHARGEFIRYAGKLLQAETFKLGYELLGKD
jgi:peroxiredoxin